MAMPLPADMFAAATALRSGQSSNAVESRGSAGTDFRPRTLPHPLRDIPTLRPGTHSPGWQIQSAGNGVSGRSGQHCAQGV